MKEEERVDDAELSVTLLPTPRPPTHWQSDTEERDQQRRREPRLERGHRRRNIGTLCYQLGLYQQQYDISGIVYNITSRRIAKLQNIILTIKKGSFINCTIKYILNQIYSAGLKTVTKTICMGLLNINIAQSENTAEYHDHNHFY